MCNKEEMWSSVIDIGLGQSRLGGQGRHVQPGSIWEETWITRSLVKSWGGAFQQCPLLACHFKEQKACILDRVWWATAGKWEEPQEYCVT